MISRMSEKIVYVKLKKHACINILYIYYIYTVYIYIYKSSYVYHTHMIKILYVYIYIYILLPDILPYITYTYRACKQDPLMTHVN